jgi:hypothetical protein
MTRGSTVKTGKSLKRAASAPAEIEISLNSKKEADRIAGSKHLAYHRENFPCNYLRIYASLVNFL